MNTVVTTAAAAAATATATAAVKSVLDKPLYELTEDDISQLTREDCRRYLKEKGMRRPSWNKSQAIQQVISLKSLLEPTPSRPSPVAARPLEIPATTSTTVTSSSSSSIKEFSAADIDGSVVALAEDRSLNQLVGPSGSDPVRDGESPGESLCAAVDSKPLPVRTANVPDLPIGQMTIFYSGKVNVYDGVPVDKAHAIMHLASSPIQFCQDEPNSGNSTHWATPRQLVTSTVKFNVAAPDAAIMSMLSDVDGQTNRQVSLQRYFEKRKDRGKFRLKRKIESSSGLEMYLDHQMRMPVANSQPTQSNSCSPDQHEVFNTGYGFVDKQPKNPGLSVDLNNQA